MGKAARFCRQVDAVNGWVGKIVSLAVIPMTVFVVLEVVLRYVFSSPTIWVWDVNGQLLALIGAMGAGFALLRGRHVSVDVVAMHLPPRTKAILDMFTSGFFFLGISVLLWRTGLAAWTSLRIKENEATMLQPPIYPLKVVIVIGVVLLLLQGIVKFIRDLNAAIYSQGVNRS